MIRRLRVRHRYLVSGLCILLPVGYAAALLARPEPNFETLDAAYHDLDRHVVTRPGAWADLFVYSVPEGERTVIRVSPGQQRREPDLLAYLTTGTAQPPAKSKAAVPPVLPKNARLLGGVSLEQTRHFTVPAGIDTNESLEIVLYSLGHSTVVARVPLEGSGVESED